MAKDQNFDIPVQGSSYAGSSRAKAAVKSASSGNPITPDTSGTPKSDQTDQNIPDKNDNLEETSQPKVLNDQTQAPIKGGTPPNQVDPGGRPGQKASKIMSAPGGRY